MRNSKKKEMLKRVKTLLLACLLMSGVAFVWHVNTAYVYAADATRVDDYLVKEYSDITEYRQKNNLKIPEAYDDATESSKWLFAGWYKDNKCTQALGSGEVCTGTLEMKGTYYAKFVSADVLSVKCQITKNTKSTSDSTKLRCVSSVDSLKYKKIGFNLVTPAGTKYAESSKVGTKINAKDTDIAYSFSPKVIDTESEYFFSAVEMIENENFDERYIVQPYWITKDGTKVYGVNKYITVMEVVTDKVPTTVHVSAKLSAQPTGSLTVTGGNAAAVSLAEYKDGYAHFAITVADRRELQSVTKFVIKEGGAEIANCIYRNLSTKYDGTDAKKDDSWYEVYKDTDDEFVIATSADLYGFAKTISKNNKFANKTVYLVNDIEANKGTANKETLTWDKAKDGNGNEIEPYHWSRVGDDSNKFAGVFDGQMHTIRGIYYDSSNASGNFHGMFGVTDTSVNIKNLCLENSYWIIENSKNAIGSIVGRTYGGEFSTIYSDAIVIGANYNIGGLIGQYPKGYSDLKLNNCWFDGYVQNNTTKEDRTGGLAGGVLSDAIITHCLNTGTISMPNKESTPGIAGLIGWIANEKIQISHCFNAGQVTYNTKATEGYGTIIGNVASGGSVEINDTFYLKNTTCLLPIDGGKNSSVTEVEKANVSGVNALTASTKTLFSYVNEETQLNDSYWAIVPNRTPVLASFAENADAMAVDTSWYNQAEGTEDDPYILKDAADLYGLAFLSKTNNFENKTLKLGADITINKGTPDEWTAETPLHNWLPIGYKHSSDANKDIRFAGTFDGQMHSINGMYLDETVSNVGMFATTNAYSTIKNLKLLNSSFKTTKGAIGSIVGYGYGTFDTIYSDAYVEGGSYWIGGFIGQTHSASNMTMNNCWFDGEVVHTGAGHATQKACVGGLLGLAHNTGTITNCLNTGSITSSATIEDPCVGGLVGRVSENKTLTIKHSFDAGSVSVEGATNAYGPVIGKVETSDKTTISTTFAYTENYADNASTTYSGVANISEDAVHGTDALKKMKDLFTYKVSATEYASYWAVVLGGAPVLESFAEEADKEFLAIDTSWYNGSKDYTLEDVADLFGFTMLSSRINFAGETVSLSKNIDSIVINDGIPQTESWNPKYEWISVGSVDKPFAGTFNGNMKSIEGVYLQGQENSGLFSTIIGDSVIQNLSLKNAYMNLSTGNQNGSIVGRSYGGTLDTVYSDAIIVGSGYNIGGLVGRVEKNSTKALTLNNCWFAGELTNNTGSGYGTGGLIGNVLNDVTVTNCLNSGDISMPKYTKNESTADTPVVRPRIGGFVGNIEAEVEIEVDGEKTTRPTEVLFSHCFNSGIITYNNVTGVTGYGTFVGYTPKTSVCFQESYSTIENGLSSYSKGGAASILLNCNRFYKSELFGTKAFDKVGVLFEANENENYRIYWGIVENGTPVLSSFAENAGNDAIAINTNWYDANKDSYTLNNAGDLYGFALISDKEAIAGYAGKTITLGQDITINKGTAADWATSAPQFKWNSICTNANYRFKGTFEGNGKTISGLYLDETNAYRGFFGYTEDGSVVRNFRIVNGFFNSTAQAIGSVAGNARGSFEGIYSNAIVVGGFSNVGGMIGQTSGEGVEITNCWFDGTVTNISAEKQSTGGLIGAANLSVTMKNCLNTGSISAPNYTKPDEGTTSIKPLVGGLIGYASPTQNITVMHCLNTGNISFNSKATAGMGSIIGRIGNLGDGQELGEIVVSNTYATSQSCWYTINTLHENLDITVTVVDENLIGGEDAEEILAGLFDDNLTTNWEVGVKNPVLKDFATYATTEKSISALHQWVVSDDTLEVTIANPITLPNPNQSNSTFFRQGGYTDGRYFYQAYIVKKDTVNDEVGNEVQVLKFDLMNPAAPAVWSTKQALRHANDITFNSKLGYLVVCHGDKNISYFDITDDGLVFVETVEVPSSISRIDYNAERDVYVTGTSKTLYILNSDLKVCSATITLPDYPEGGARQSISCDNDYLYYAITNGHAEGDHVEQIEVYDWFGQLVTTITVKINSTSKVTELENISVVGDKLYVMVAEYSAIGSFQYDKPANVYTIDLTKSE